MDSLSWFSSESRLRLRRVVNIVQFEHSILLHVNETGEENLTPSFETFLNTLVSVMGGDGSDRPFGVELYYRMEDERTLEFHGERRTAYVSSSPANGVHWNFHGGQYGFFLFEKMTDIFSTQLHSAAQTF